MWEENVPLPLQDLRTADHPLTNPLENRDLTHSLWSALRSPPAIH